jgi:large subunit ribosomal protein L35
MGNKMKTRKAAAKRIMITAGGKVKHRKPGLAHLQTKRSSRTQMRNPDGAIAMAGAEKQRVQRMLPGR